MKNIKLISAISLTLLIIIAIIFFSTYSVRYFHKNKLTSLIIYKAIKIMDVLPGKDMIFSMLQRISLFLKNGFLLQILKTREF